MGNGERKFVLNAFISSGCKLETATAASPFPHGKYRDDLNCKTNQSKCSPKVQLGHKIPDFSQHSFAVSAVRTLTSINSALGVRRSSKMRFRLRGTPNTL